jgi:hypothetical protein
MKNAFSYFFDKWWSPILFYIIIRLIFWGIQSFISSNAYSIGLFCLLGIAAIFALITTIYQFKKHRWWQGGASLLFFFILTAPHLIVWGLALYIGNF